MFLVLDIEHPDCACLIRHQHSGSLLRVNGGCGYGPIKLCTVDWRNFQLCQVDVTPLYTSTKNEITALSMQTLYTSRHYCSINLSTKVPMAVEDAHFALSISSDNVLRSLLHRYRQGCHLGQLTICSKRHQHLVQELDSAIHLGTQVDGGPIFASSSGHQILLGQTLLSNCHLMYTNDTGWVTCGYPVLVVGRCERNMLDWCRMPCIEGSRQLPSWSVQAYCAICQHRDQHGGGKSRSLRGLRTCRSRVA
mmetsp:Transcript_51360/g.94928  ORF Transcript_51360/g.94928 Transcript_51360/m.94928 type:complete len:250 (+) Transcript_51360:559-1308(+)